MNYLLDTHVFLWMLADPGKLNRESREAIQNPSHAVFVSAVTGIEIAIKVGLGKLQVPDQLMGNIESRGLQHLPLHFRHSEILRTLPRHHGDPFDRLLISQAMDEKLIMITHDKKFQNYPLKVLLT